MNTGQARKKTEEDLQRDADILADRMMDSLDLELIRNGLFDVDGYARCRAEELRHIDQSMKRQDIDTDGMGQIASLESSLAQRPPASIVNQTDAIEIAPPILKWMEKEKQARDKERKAWKASQHNTVSGAGSSDDMENPLGSKKNSRNKKRCNIS